MTTMSCALCGLEDSHVSVGLVEWSEPVEEQRFSAVPRCIDAKACRERVVVAGERWEVVESGAMQPRSGLTSTMR